jgi:hypothetical protein
MIDNLCANRVPRVQLLKRMRKFLETHTGNFPGLRFDPLEIQFA